MKIILSLFLSVSCLCQSIRAQEVEYKSKNGYYTFVFKGDTGFKYSYFAGFHSYVSDGYYKRINKNLILNSRLDSSVLIPLIIEEFKDRVQEKLAFEIINAMPLDSNRRYVVLLDGKKVGSSIDKKIEIDQIKKFSTIQLMLLCKKRNYVPIEIRDSLVSDVYLIKDIKSDLFKIHWDIEPDLFNYIPIKNDILKLKRNKIIWPKENIVLLKKRVLNGIK